MNIAGEDIDRVAPGAGWPQAPAGATGHLPEDVLSRLILSTSQGCRTSFEHLYRLTRTRMMGQVLRMLKDPAEAEDSLQDIYVKVWRQARNFDARKGDAMVWLAAVARHDALDKLRRRAARPLRGETLQDLDEEDPYADHCSGDEGPLIAFARQRMFEQLSRSIAELRPVQRQCISLALFEGLSHAEISSRLRHPLGTVKAWVRKALGELRPGLAHHLDLPRASSPQTQGLI